jgi:hypothetical protein
MDCRGGRTAARVVAHLNLGALLCDEKRDYDRAIAEFSEAIRLKKDYPEAQGVG